MATYLNDRGFSFVWQKYILCRQSEMILSGVNKETENTNNNVLDSGEMLLVSPAQFVLHFPVSSYCLSLIIIIIVV